MILQINGLRNVKIGIFKRNLYHRKIVSSFLKIIRLCVLFLVCSFIFSVLSMIFKPRYHDLFGLIDQQGNELFSPQFDEIAKGYEFIAVRTNNLWGFVDRNGQMIVEPKYYYLSYLMGSSSTTINDTDGLMAVADDKYNWGVVDSSGNERIKPQYEFVDIEYGGLIWIKKNNLYGLVNQHGRIIIPCIFEDYHNFYNRRAWVKKNGKWAQINYDGEYLSDFLFDDVKVFLNGDIAEVKMNGRIHLRRNDGRFIPVPKYQSVYVYENGAVEIKINNKSGVVDDSDRFIIKPLYDGIYIMRNGYKIWKNDKIGLTDFNGRVILDPIFDEALFYSHDIVMAMKNGFWYLYDISGKPITLEKYTDWENNDNSAIIIVKSGNEWQLLNKDGSRIAGCECESISSFSEGMAVISIDDKKGFIDMTGKIIINPIYSAAGYFRNGAAIVRMNDECYLIDKMGNRISKNYNDLQLTYSGMFISTDWGEWSKKAYSK